MLCRLEGRASLQVLADLHRELVEGALELLVEHFVLVADVVHGAALVGGAAAAVLEAVLLPAQDLVRLRGIGR